jgi:hypothetical protein
MVIKVQGSVVTEQGITFAIIIVKPFVLQNSNKANETIGSFGRYFPGMPIILMAQDGSGVPFYYGRTDIVNFLASVPMEVIPWKEYTFNI